MDPTTEEIRQRADIVDVVGQYVALRPAGRDRWKACCPFHDEKTPSFSVSRDKGFYHCFGCGVSGDVFKFLQQIENLSFAEVKKQLADRYGVTLARPSREASVVTQAEASERDRLLKVMAAAAAFFREQLRGKEGADVRGYARGRGLSSATLDRFGIGYAPDAWDTLQHHLVNQYGFKPEDAAAAGLLVEKTNDDGRVRYYDRYRHRLMFPIWDQQGRVIAFGGRALAGGQTGNPDAKYINSPEGLLFKKSHTLYAWHIARAGVARSEAVIVTEGYMDAIALHEAGLANTVATLGTALTVEHAAALRRLSPKIVYLCYDGDSAGMKAALRAGPLFTANQLDVRVVLLPGGHDPDTFVREHGEAGFRKALGQARLLAQYRLERAVSGSDLKDIAQRAEAVRAATEVISEVASNTERGSYVDWLADRWAAAEGFTDPARLALVQTAIRREVEAATRRQRQSTLAARPDGYWAQQRQAAEAEQEQTSETLSQTAAGTRSGVVKAERLLLCSLLNSPAWRMRILAELPPCQWTQETHSEIVAALLAHDSGEPVRPVALLETLPAAAGELVSELLVSDEAQMATDDRLIASLIERVQGYWKRQIEREMLQLVGLKLDRGEPVSEMERDAYKTALFKTRRKTSPA